MSKQIERRSPNTDFHLNRMELLYEEANGKADVPHRHDYYTVLLVESAKGSHLIDYQSFSFEGLEVYFVSPGQVHQVSVDEKPKGWVITFSPDFLIENNIPISFISNINLFQNFGESPPLKLDPLTFNRLRRIVNEIAACMPLELAYRKRALGALLQLFLIFCNNSTSLNQIQLDEENVSVCMLRDFKRLVDNKFSEWHQVKQYASEMNITPKHLSQTVKNLSGKAAKTLIQNRIILEAKRLLLHTSLSIKEIAYQIGFEEPLHFSGFFKRQTSTSPTQFRGAISSN